MQLCRRAIALLAISTLASCTSSGAVDAGVADDAAAQADAGALKPLRVLFLGNSYTYVNDLPEQVRALVASAAGAPEIAVDSVTMGGARLSDLYQTTDALAKIRTGGWTHIVIQGQSLEAVWPLQDPSGFEDFAARFGREANAVGATPVYYETWARRAGDAIYDNPELTPATMQAELQDSYRQAAWGVGGIMAPIGDAWKLELASSAQELFAADGSHPSTRGTYLAGCVLFQVLTERSPIALGAVPAAVTADDATALQAVAAQACANQACARAPIMRGSATLSPSGSCVINNYCSYAPQGCDVTLMTNIAGPSDSAAEATFAANCTLHLIAMNPVGQAQVHDAPGEDPAGCSADLLVHTASYTATVREEEESGMLALMILGSGPLVEEPGLARREGNYTMSFAGIMDPQQTRAAGTASIRLDDLCTFSGALSVGKGL